MKVIKKIAAFLFMSAMAFAFFAPMSVKAEEDRTAVFV